MLRSSSSELRKAHGAGRGAGALWEHPSGLDRDSRCWPWTVPQERAQLSGDSRDKLTPAVTRLVPALPRAQHTEGPRCHPHLSPLAGPLLLRVLQAQGQRDSDSATGKGLWATAGLSPIPGTRSAPCTEPSATDPPRDSLADPGPGSGGRSGTGTGASPPPNRRNFPELPRGTPGTLGAPSPALPVSPELSRGTPDTPELPHGTPGTLGAPPWHSRYPGAPPWHSRYPRSSFSGTPGTPGALPLYPRYPRSSFSGTPGTPEAPSPALPLPAGAGAALGGSVLT